jgi:protein phosphatase
MIEIGSALDPGRKRIASPNQDCIGVVRTGLFNWRSPLLVLADGMGGYEGGLEASQTVVNQFIQVYQRSKIDANPLQVLQDGVSAALSAMRQQAAEQPDLSYMGSTVVAAMLKGRNIHLLNVGDSRAYLVGRSQVRQLSYDHSLVGEQFRQGLITEAQVRVHPRRNVLSMCLNAQRNQVETFTGVFDWQPGDHLVLCSDGLWGPVTETQMQSVVCEFPPQQAADRLVQLANANLGPDNISVIIARLV